MHVLLSLKWIFETPHDEWYQLEFILCMKSLPRTMETSVMCHNKGLILRDFSEWRDEQQFLLKAKLFRRQYASKIQTSVYIKEHLVLSSTISYWWKFSFWSTQISYSSHKITLRPDILTGGNSCIECGMWHVERKEKQ